MNFVSTVPETVANEKAAAAARQRKKEQLKRLIRLLDVDTIIMAIISFALTQAYAVADDQLETGS
jgi:hypothetical protein